MARHAIPTLQRSVRAVALALAWTARVAVAAGANVSGSQSRPFVIGQLEASQRFFGGLAGNYRLYAWTNGRATDFDGAQARHSGGACPPTSVWATR